MTVPELRDAGFEYSPVPLAVVSIDGATEDPDGGRLGIVLVASRRFIRLVGLDDLTGQRLTDLVLAEDRALLDEPLGALRDPMRDMDVRLVRPSWGLLWVRMDVEVISVAGRRIAVVSFSDVSGTRRAQAELERQATHDALTGLPNRALLMNHLEHSLATLQRRPGAVAAIFMDLDGFKDINDTYGHSVGDQLLAEVASRVSVAIRAQDLVSRLGGDEFAVVCDTLESHSESAVVAERIRAGLQAPIVIDGRPLRVSASIGVAQTSDPRTNPEDLLRRADLAMYAAKQGGRNCVEFFEKGLESASRQRVRLKEQVLNSLEGTAEPMEVQPVLGLLDMTRVGWAAAAGPSFMQLDQLGPDELSGRLLDRIHERMWQQALGFLADLQSDRFLAVPVTDRALRSPFFAKDTLAQLAEAGVDPERLVIEVDTGNGARFDEGPARTLRKLRGAGVRVSLRGFGASAASLQAFRELDVDFVHLSEAMVADLGGHQIDDSIVSAVISVSHEVGREVIATGVDTPFQVDFLVKNDCDYAQGNMFGPWSPVGEV
ncbi:MAG: diguanylate cyclase [Actinobacteria bacterium]|nr:diguanylate cyclase [Actinomycetota bacterium]